MSDLRSHSHGGDVAFAALVDVADDLEAQGRRLEAVDALQAALRVERDPEIARRLVALRHDAYDELDDPPLPGWPPVYPDPFPDVVGEVPEIERAELSTEVLGGAILHHGSLLVRGLLEPDEVERMQHDADRTFDARFARKAGAELDEVAPWFVPFRKGTHTTFGWEYVVRVPDSPSAMFDLVEIYRRSGVVDAIAGYLGERPALSSEKCCFRRAPVQPHPEFFHQDGSFFGEDCRTVNCWIALTRCGDTAPGIDMLPRRVHRVVPTGTVGAGMYWTISTEVVAEEGDGVEVVRPVLDAGDAFLFDNLAIHRTGMSLDMVEERRSIECWFFAPSTYPERDVPIVI